MGIEQVPVRRCGHALVHRLLLDSHPEYVEAVRAAEAEPPDGPLDTAVESNETLTIRTVVHVIHHTDDTQLVTDAQVHSQIDALNRDFQAQNGDIAAVPDPFKGVVGNSRIRFELAQIAPDGTVTNGITWRVQDQRQSFNISDNAVKSTAAGGQDPWDTTRYMNIWVCNLEVYLGHATGPGTPASVDGVVIRGTAFGNTGIAEAPYNMGRTGTHEVGHYLNLKHIFGDLETTCDSPDGVNDTPRQMEANQGRPSFPKPSQCGEPNGDMFMNFMDYVFDDTMLMFTKGQAARMRRCVKRKRSGLLVDSPMLLAGPTMGAPIRHQQLSAEALYQYRTRLEEHYLLLAHHYEALRERGQLDARGAQAYAQVRSVYDDLRRR